MRLVFLRREAEIWRCVCTSQWFSDAEEFIQADIPDVYTNVASWSLTAALCSSGSPSCRPLHVNQHKKKLVLCASKSHLHGIGPCYILFTVFASQSLTIILTIYSNA